MKGRLFVGGVSAALLAGGMMLATGCASVEDAPMPPGAYVPPETEAPIAAGVGSDGYVVAVGTEKGELVVISAEGQKLWSTFLTSEMDAIPLVGHGLVIVRTADTRVTAFDAMTGEQRWRYHRQAPSLTVKNASGSMDCTALRRRTLAPPSPR